MNTLKSILIAIILITSGVTTAVADAGSEINIAIDNTTDFDLGKFLIDRTASSFTEPHKLMLITQTDGYEVLLKKSVTDTSKGGRCAVYFARIDTVTSAAGVLAKVCVVQGEAFIKIYKTKVNNISFSY